MNRSHSEIASVQVPTCKFERDTSLHFTSALGMDAKISESNQEPFDADPGQTKMAAWLARIPASRKKKFILVFIKSGSKE